VTLRHGLIVLALVLALEPRAAGQTASFDWPQWRGLNRDAVSKETGLLKQWPRTGPPVAWTAANLGNGFGSVAVQGDRVYVQGLRNRQSVVSALDRATGAVAWTRPIGRGGENDRGSGPRSTPTIDGDRAYVLTEAGDLAALRVADGSILWQRNILTDFRGRNIQWLVSESPLVDGSHVIVTPGGRGAGLAALDKMTGKTVWTTAQLSDEAGYASAIVADIQGVRTVMTITAEAGVGVRASDGMLMWRNGQAANGTANITTPVYADNKVFYTSAYGAGAVLLNLSALGGVVRAQEAYFTRNMQNHHGGVVLVGRHLYGFNNAVLACLDFATGQSVWRDRSVGKGSVAYADGNLYLLSEDNVVGLAEATPDGYREKGRFPIADQGWNSWSHPVVSGGRLYIRNQQTLTSYDVRAR
jgi:outer membrane protein assembly factor BamB